MTTRAPKPSPAQARFLALVWGGNEPTRINDSDTSTMRACVSAGWLAPTGKVGFYPNPAFTWTEYTISKEGIRALADFLAKEGAP